MMKIAKRTALASDDDNDRGWNISWRDDDKQWELSYRAAPGRWRKHRIPRSVGAEAQAEKYAAAYVDEKRRMGTLDAPAEIVIASTSEGPTFGTFATDWTSGKLHRKHPDHIRAKRTSDDDATRIEILSDALSHVPLSRFSLDDAERAMSTLDDLRQAKENAAAARANRPPRKVKPLSPASRRQYAQIIHRVLAMAVYPARLIAANPLPRGFLPKASGKKAEQYLYPDEDAKLLKCTAVPLALRVLYGFLTREGLRAGEALSLTWDDLDLERGALRLDHNKTDDPRAWALSPGVAAALTAWKKHLATKNIATKGADIVFVHDEPARERAASSRRRRSAKPEPVRTIDRFGLADGMREHLAVAGVDRAELLDNTKGRRPIRAHDLRATFVTVSLANGKTEAWVSARTGHRSSQMVSRYRRAAQKVEELSLGGFVPLDEALPELRSEKPATTSAAPVEAQHVPVQSSATIAALVADLVAVGLSRARRRRATRRNQRVGQDRLELSANGLRVRCSTN